MSGDPGKDREPLVEAVASAFRPRDPDGAVRSLPAFHDLDETGRREAFERAQALRAMEAAMDPAGLSCTSRAVMARIRAAGTPRT